MSILFWIIMGILVIITMSLLTYRKRRTARREKLVNAFGLLIERAIFWENEDAADSNRYSLPIPGLFKEMLHKKSLRKWFINELVLARDNLTGESSENLKRLYMQLKFQEDSFAKLQSGKWFIKVQGIRELNLMDQNQFEKNIFEYTNDRNEYVRMEAQLAIISFNGFAGLNFLNGLTEEITLWNQIRLLDQLDEMPYQDFKGVDRWLNSENDSVVLFALKLAGVFHLFDLEDTVIACLDHPNKVVNIQALRTLADIYEEDTGIEIIKRYHRRDTDYRIEGIKTLGEMRSEQYVPFLIQEWQKDEIPLKLGLCRAIFQSSPNAEQLLQTVGDINVEPDHTIIAQVKTEMI